MTAFDAERWQRLAPYLDELLDMTSDEARAGRLSALRLEDAALADDLQMLLDDRRDVAARHFLEHDPAHLVSAAATPLGGDTIALKVIVEPGARLRLRTAAATVTLPGRTTAESNTHWHLEVAGDLDVDPEPTVVAGGSRHVSSTRLSVTGSGRVRLRERVQIGRTDERQGFWSGSLHADVNGQPLLRHRIELGEESATHDLLMKFWGSDMSFNMAPFWIGGVAHRQQQHLPVALFP